MKITGTEFLSYKIDKKQGHNTRKELQFDKTNESNASLYQIVLRYFRH